MKIVAVIVTFNRLELLKENIKKLLEQTYPLDKIYIIDNASTDDTEEYCKEAAVENEKIIYRRLNENIGGAGGFSKGIQYAYEEGADYIWGMDDDAMPRKDALNELVHGMKNFDDRKVCLRSNTYYIDDKGSFVLEQVTEHNQEMSGLTFVGFYISRNVVEKAGIPRDDLFIYFDEVDYSMSIQENGFKIIGIRESVIEHPYILSTINKKILFKEIRLFQMPDWKKYYWMRNNLLVRKKRGRHFFKALILEIYDLIKTILFQRSQVKVACKGLWHGIIGKSGHEKGMP